MSTLKRSVLIAGHATSVTLESEFWEALKNLAERKGCSINALVNDIDAAKTIPNLSSAIRVYILKTLINNQ